MTSEFPWPIVATIVSALIGIIGALILLNLQTIKRCISKLSNKVNSQDNTIAEIKRDFASCKIDCDRNNVSKEDWVRSEAFTRDKLDKVAATLNRMEGKLDIVEKIPQIAGAIAREIAGQINKAGG